MSRNFKIVPGELYHIYNRGTDRRNIFTSVHDYERFLTLLYVSNGSTPVHLQLQGSTLNKVRDIDLDKKLVNMGAYCLMPNHFHLLINQKDKGKICHCRAKLLAACFYFY